MLFDIFSAYSGENSIEIDRKYQKLKAVSEIAKKNYQEGKITEQEYKSYLNTLREYERR